MRNLLAALRALPDVESAGLSAAELLSGGSWNQPLTLESGQRLVTDTVHCNAISPGFLETLGVPLLHGRAFNERDAHDIQNLDFRSAIINESFAKRYFGGGNAIGARVGLGNTPDTRANIEIVGVVKTFSYRGLRDIEDQAFFPLFERRINGGGFWVRARTPSQSAFSSIRAAVRQVDSTLPDCARLTTSSTACW